MARIDKLSNFLTDVADSIRNKTGDTANISPANFDTEIASISTGYTPPTSTGFANDSWATINEICEHGLAEQYYSVGDYKVITLSAVTDNGGYYNRNISAGNIRIYIIGFRELTCPTGYGGKSHMIFMVRGRDGYNISFGGQYFGFAGASRLKDWLNNIFYNALPTDLKSLVKPYTCQTLNTYNGVASRENLKIAIPCLYQIGGRSIYFTGDRTNSLPVEGDENYNIILPGFAQDVARAAVLDGSTRRMLTRSPYNYGSDIYTVNSTTNDGGSILERGSTTSSTAHWILPMFCI